MPRAVPRFGKIREKVTKSASGNLPEAALFRPPGKTFRHKTPVNIMVWKKLWKVCKSMHLQANASVASPLFPALSEDGFFAFSAVFVLCNIEQRRDLPEREKYDKIY